MHPFEHPFENDLSVPEENLASSFSVLSSLDWSEFWLNPRRLRGSDFLMRWSQGRWSEDRLVGAIDATERYFALPYGPSGIAPTEVRAYELYFERLENAGLGKLKRPDLLVFRNEDRPMIQAALIEMGGLEELPFLSEEEPLMQTLLKKAILAIECENSLWVARQMPDYGKPLTPQKRLGGELGMKKAAVLPTVILKEEDRPFLNRWQETRGVPIHIWHAFYDLAFGIALTEIETLIASGKIEPTLQVFQAPGGATSKKAIYKIYNHYAYPLGETQGEVKLVPEQIVDKNGHILPYVRFQGGEISLT